MMRPPSMQVANFDSAFGVLNAVARFMEGEDFPLVGLPRFLKPVPRLAHRLPRGIRERVYALGGAAEGLPPDDLGQVDAEALSEWAVGHYPEGRRYPGVVIGSSNGAAVHLCAAFGMAWLPQTLLVPVRRPPLHPDEMTLDMEWGREPARRLLAANPEVQLHHMHDPNQDRLMVERMSYFRIKRLRLGRAYERFLLDSLEPGGTIFLLDCQKRWPVKKLGERHFFQPGAMGGLEAAEYLEGSERVAAFLERYGSHRRSWQPPEVDEERPEAEWGYEPALTEDVRRFADLHGFRVRRIAFQDPEDPSPLVADLYRSWYRDRGLPANRLLGETFILLEPFWALRTGSVPFWMKFNVESSAAALERYLEGVEPFDEIHLMLFSHGTESAGLASIDRWREIQRRAERGGRLLGVDEERYPADFGVFGRYHDELRRLPSRYSIPGPLSLEALDRFVAERGERYSVQWLEEPTESAARPGRSERAGRADGEPVGAAAGEPVGAAAGASVGAPETGAEGAPHAEEAGRPEAEHAGTAPEG